MKEYTIKDSLGNKKTIYAENLSHAMTFVDSKVNDANFKESNNVYYKFERGYWHVLSIHNKTEMDHQDVMSLARKNNVMIEPYFKYDYHRTDKGGYYTDYKVKGKDKNGVIKFCETMNPIVKPLTFSNDTEDSKVKDDELEGKYHTKYGDKLIISKINASTYSYFDVDTKTSIRVSINALKEDIKAKRLIKDSKIVDAVQSAETYANTGWIENKLASDLINEGQKNDYDFDAVLKKFDSLSKQILAVVKNALDNARKEIVDYKSRY